MAPIIKDITMESANGQSDNLKMRKTLHRNTMHLHYKQKIPTFMAKSAQSIECIQSHPKGVHSGIVKDHLSNEVVKDHKEFVGYSEEWFTRKSVKEHKKTSFQSASEEVCTAKNWSGEVVLGEERYADLTTRTSQPEQRSVYGCSVGTVVKEKSPMELQAHGKQQLNSGSVKKKSKLFDNHSAARPCNDCSSVSTFEMQRESWIYGEQGSHSSKATFALCDNGTVVEEDQETYENLLLSGGLSNPVVDREGCEVATIEEASRFTEVDGGHSGQVVGIFQLGNSEFINRPLKMLQSDGEGPSSTSCDASGGVEIKPTLFNSGNLMLKQLEVSLQERDCGRAMEIFQSWKEGFKAEVEPGSTAKINNEGSPNIMLAYIPGRKKGFIVSIDISRGLETLPISCVNEYNTNILPEDFLYITESVISAAAHVDRSFSRIGDLHCNCSGDCVRSSETCKCTDATRGECAYDEKGQLIARLATSFQSRLGTERGDFITECCSKCRCCMQCGNRVVQRGITKKLQVYMTPNRKGWGVRALEKIPANSFVFEYIGEIATNKEQILRNGEYRKKGTHSYTMNLDADSDMELRHFGEGLSDNELLVLDATHYGNVARFVNHRCYDANLFVRPVQIETRDTHYYHVAFFAAHDIQEMEELTWDYNIDFEDNENTAMTFKCRCNSNHCRDTSRKKKSKLIYVKI